MLFRAYSLRVIQNRRSRNHDGVCSCKREICCYDKALSWTERFGCFGAIAGWLRYRTCNFHGWRRVVAIPLILPLLMGSGPCTNSDDEGKKSGPNWNGYFKDLATLESHFSCHAGKAIHDKGKIISFYSIGEGRRYYHTPMNYKLPPHHSVVRWCSS